MDPGIIRWIDKNIGRPCCFFLTLHHKASDIFKRNNPAYQKPAKLLFTKLYVLNIIPQENVIEIELESIVRFLKLLN